VKETHHSTSLAPLPTLLRSLISLHLLLMKKTVDYINVLLYSREINAGGTMITEAALF